MILSIQEIIEHSKSTHNQTLGNNDLFKQLFYHDSVTGTTKNIEMIKTNEPIEAENESNIFNSSQIEEKLESSKEPSTLSIENPSINGLSLIGSNIKIDKDDEGHIKPPANKPLSYDSEILDNGSQIFICSACKLVFLNIDTIKVHTCKQEMLNNPQQVASRKSSDAGRLVDNKSFDKLEKHENLRDNDFLNDEIIMEDDDDDDNGKMNGDIIYME